MRVSEQQILGGVADLEPVSIGDLAVYLNTNKAALTQMLVRGLEPERLVSLRKGPDAVVRVSLTQPGWDALDGP